MYTKLQEMIGRNRNISKLRFDKELKLLAEETGKEYSSLKAQKLFECRKGF